MTALLFALVLSQGADESPADTLRRAKNEYAYGNYDTAIAQLRSILYPLRLIDDGQVLDARLYLALSSYLQGDLEQVDEEFQKILFVSPDYRLDPFTIAPPVVERFEQVRTRLAPTLEAIKRRRTEPPPVLQPDKVVETRIVARSPLATLLPFGIGQFQNGQSDWGWFFLTTQTLLLGANVGSYLYATHGIGNGFSADQRDDVNRFTAIQYTSAALFGVVWALGVLHARQNFVEETRSTTERFATTPSNVAVPDPIE